MKFSVTYEELNKLILYYTKEMDARIQLEYLSENACAIHAQFKGFKFNWVISNPTVCNNAISFNNNVNGLITDISIVNMKDGLINIDLNTVLRSNNVPIKIESLVFTNTGADVCGIVEF